MSEVIKPGTNSKVASEPCVFWLKTPTIRTDNFPFFNFFYYFCYPQQLESRPESV